jgi:hypothetical protein
MIFHFLFQKDKKEKEPTSGRSSSLANTKKTRKRLQTGQLEQMTWLLSGYDLSLEADACTCQFRPNGKIRIANIG